MFDHPIYRFYSLTLALLFTAGCQPFTKSQTLDSTTMSACAEDEVTTGPCVVQQAGKVVSGNIGSDITVWQNGDAGTALITPIPDGYYTGQSITFSDTDLVAANILAGVSVFGVMGAAIEAYSLCSDNALNASQCSTATNRYVTGTAGANVNGGNGSLSATIPQGFYSGAQSCTMSDTNLLASNILSGVTIFGVAGSATAVYSACSDNALNASQCSTATNRYVTGTAGANVSGGNGSLSATIPQGFYSGAQSCTMSDTQLLASNVKNGITLFGVTGSYLGSFMDVMASTMFRDANTNQIAVGTESTTNAGTAYLNDPSGYRAIPDITKDDEGRIGLTGVNRSTGSTGAWGARTCGTVGTISVRISSCATEFSTDATWVGATMGNSGQGIWRLVTRSGDISAGRGREVWQDQRTGLLWSSLVSGATNWCKASGSNNITGNPVAQDDPNDFCDNATYQTTGAGPGVFAVSACFDDPDYFTSTDGSIDTAGYAGLNSNSNPSVAWRLPTRDDYLVAEVNGLRQVLPDAGDPNGYWEWTATLDSSNRSRAWLYSSWDGAVASFSRDSDYNVRCVGR